MKTPTLRQFQAWAKANRSKAVAVCVAKAFAQCERERVDAYIQPIFDSFNFQYRGDLAEKYKLSGPCPRKHLYLCEDPRIPEYYAACDAAHREHGFKGPEGHCPALIAEHDLMVAERAIIKAGCDFLGVESTKLIYGDTREKMLDLLLGACLADQRKAA